HLPLPDRGADAAGRLPDQGNPDEVGRRARGRYASERRRAILGPWQPEGGNVAWLKWTSTVAALGAAALLAAAPPAPRAATHAPAPQTAQSAAQKLVVRLNNGSWVRDTTMRGVDPSFKQLMDDNSRLA